MSTMTFSNLPVKDLTKTTEFFTKLGFSFDQQFTDENATRMIISDDASVMLAVEPFFQGFITPQGITDTSTSREVIVGLSAKSREQVDDLVEKALTGRRTRPGRTTRRWFHVHVGFPRPRRAPVVIHLHGHIRHPRQY